MGSVFIREGDATSHGGRVLACTSTNTVLERAIALEGDMVSCPRCRGVYSIVGVRIRSMTFDGRAVATEGDKTACGATLITSQGGSDGGADVGGRRGGRCGHKRCCAACRARRWPISRGCFQLVDDHTREPIANHPYRVTSADGQMIQGTTDANGYTAWLESHRAASLFLFSQPGTSGAVSMGEA